jgi:cAMP-specific phosphodiesterase 4
MYQPISYHNKTHAADVCQTMYFYINKCDFRLLGALSDLELFVTIISPLVHDTDHPGFNNPFMVASKDKLALRYNDRSVLENHHIAIAFDTMLTDPESKIYENFDDS